MRKRKKGKKFSRKRDQRKALFKTLAVSFLLREKIKTTEAKAKELSRFVEKQITRAKAGNLQVKKQLATLFPKEIVKKLTEEIAPKYKERNGGYTRVIKLGPRKSNGAKMAIIELIK